MRKLWVYIFFFGLFGTPAAHAFALASAQEDATTAEYDTIQPDNQAVYSDASGTFSFYKDDLLNDNDNDNDNDEASVHVIMAKKKDLGITTISLNNAPSDLKCTDAGADHKIYHHTNFSRLPRFTYLSLSVFRL